MTLKSLLSAVIVALCLSLPAQARVYVYTGNNAMAKMMLDFLEAMGFIHRMPDRYAADLMRRYPAASWGGFPTSSLWGVSPSTGMSSLAAPMMLGGMMQQPGQNNGMSSLAAPMMLGSMMQQPGLNNGMSSLASPMMLGNMMQQQGGAYDWSKMSHWPLLSSNATTTSSPWESSVDTLRYSEQFDSPRYDDKNGRVEMSVDDLQDLLDDRRHNPASEALPEHKRNNNDTAVKPRQKRLASKGVDRLSGLWMGKNRDILTVTGNRFIWTDPSGKITKGTFRLQGDTMLVQAEGVNAPAIYKVRYSGDHLIATSQGGYSYEFTRSRLYPK